MGIQETVRRQEEKLVAQGKPPKPQSQPAASVDVQTLRQMIEDVVRTELQAMRDEQPRPQPSEVDVQALQHAVQLVVRAELQPLQAAVTIMANAIQAQTDALISEGDEENQDEPLPTALSHHTDDDIEDEQVYPPTENDDEEEFDDVGDEEGEGGEEEEGYPVHPPRPESPTHRLRRPGPVGILLGSGDAFHPSTGSRRWEPTV